MVCPKWGIHTGDKPLYCIILAHLLDQCSHANQLIVTEDLKSRLIFHLLRSSQNLRASTTVRSSSFSSVSYHFYTNTCCPQDRPWNFMTTHTKSELRADCHKLKPNGVNYQNDGHIYYWRCKLKADYIKCPCSAQDFCNIDDTMNS